MDTIKHTEGDIPITAEWDAAYQRVESYLHAMQIRNRPILNRLVQRILERTRERIAQGESLKPVEVAGQEMMHQLARWYQSVLPVAQDEDETALLTRGKMALIMSRLTPQRQALILSDTVEDEAFLEELRRAYSLTGPDFEKATMRARPLDLGLLPRAADRALAGLDRWPKVRHFLLWVLILGLFGLLFYYTR